MTDDEVNEIAMAGWSNIRDYCEHLAAQSIADGDDVAGLNLMTAALCVNMTIELHQEKLPDNYGRALMKIAGDIAGIVAKGKEDIEQLRAAKMGLN